MSNALEDTRTLIKMGTAQRLLARQLAQQLIANPSSPPTPGMLEIAELIAHPTPEHQQRLLAIASDDDEPTAA